MSSPYVRLHKNAPIPAAHSSMVNAINIIWLHFPCRHFIVAENTFCRSSTKQSGLIPLLLTFKSVHVIDDFMERRGLILLLIIALTTGFVFPMPECFVSKMDCDRQVSASCPVFAGSTPPENISCGTGCPLSESRDEQEKPKKGFEPFVKLKTYPIRSLANLVPLMDWAPGALLNTSLAYGGSLQIGYPSTFANRGERASPIFLQNQSLLF